MPLDYSKFDKIEDSDEEQDYDRYLRSRYGVESDWKPGCGMQPPVLGGRTPGKMFEECELKNAVEFELPAKEVSSPETTPAAVVVNDHAASGKIHIYIRIAFIFVRLLQLAAWVMPVTMAVLHITIQRAARNAPAHVKAKWLEYSDGSQEVSVESVVYPLTIACCLMMGALDVGFVWYVKSPSEGPVLVAFSCWCKRMFLALSFIAYEAQVAIYDADAFAKPWSGMAMITAWTGRKVCGYIKDVRAVTYRAETIPWRKSQSRVWHPVPGGRTVLLIEAMSETLFLLVHLTMMPQGIRLFGFQNPTTIWVVTGSIFFVCNLTAFRKSAPSSFSDTKDEHVE